MSPPRRCADDEFEILSARRRHVRRGFGAPFPHDNVQRQRPGARPSACTSDAGAEPRCENSGQRSGHADRHCVPWTERHVGTRERHRTGQARGQWRHRCESSPRSWREQCLRARSARDCFASGLSRQPRRLPVLDLPQHRASRRPVLPRRTHVPRRQHVCRRQWRAVAGAAARQSRRSVHLEWICAHVRPESDHASRVSERRRADAAKSGRRRRSRRAATTTAA